MSAVISTAVRKFNFKGESLSDPDPTMSVTEVIDFYSGKYPELTAAIIKEPVEKDGIIIYDLEFSVGHKA